MASSRRLQNLAALSLLTTVLALIPIDFEAHAALLTVNSLDETTGDDGVCTLREAMIAANTGNSSGTAPGECPAGEFEPVIDRIAFAAGTSGTINLDSALPIILDPLAILGPGPADLIIDGAAVSTNNGVLRVLSPTSVEGLSVINTTSTDAGGAINASQPLTLNNVVIQNNEATTGGGIYSTRDLLIENSAFRGNRATAFDGGAIRMADSDRGLIIRDSLFEGNVTGPAARSGGAIYVGGTGHDTEITGSTFVGNHVLGSNRDGGAIRVGGAGFVLENSTLTDNTATGSGGALSLRAIGHELSNVTVAANTADSDADGIGDGGGIWLTGSFAVVRNTLVSGNQTLDGSGADCEGSFTTAGYNLISRGEGCVGFTDDVGGDQVGTSLQPIDPLLAALADNGGRTPTLALLEASPAIDAGNPSDCEGYLGNLLVFDQRGQPRPQDGDADGSPVCDIGAFELAADTIFSDRFEE